ncbi:NAD(P)-dependent oxidoreductase [Photobacterium indicum]|uniref:NAD(P)-dependent oxidoreductase n=1 Tax=Photobacterium indicum TaxID=81447 RepID=UPI003D09CD46
MNIYIHPVLNERDAKYLTQQLPAGVSCYFNDGSNVFEGAKDAVIAIGNIPTDWINDMPCLTTILLDSVGTDNFNGYDWSENCHITVCNLQGFFSAPVAEEIVANVLSVYRQLPALQTAKTSGEWEKDAIRFTKRLVGEADILILGYGSIGKQTANLFEAFGATIHCFDTTDMKVNGKAGLIEAVTHCDILISTIPATDTTHNLLDCEVFNKMRAGGMVVNVGRGQVVNEDDLVEKALADSTFTACLDVTKQEPLPTHSPLWTTPNIHLTQHTGGGCGNENTKKIDVYVRQIHRLFNGEPLQNCVSFERITMQ